MYYKKSVSVAQSDADSNSILFSEGFAQSESLAFKFLNRLNSLNNPHPTFNSGFVHWDNAVITLGIEFSNPLITLARNIIDKSIE